MQGDGVLVCLLNALPERDGCACPLSSMLYCLLRQRLARSADQGEKYGTRKPLGPSLPLLVRFWG